MVSMIARAFCHAPFCLSTPLCCSVPLLPTINFSNEGGTVFVVQSSKERTKRAGEEKEKEIKLILNVTVLFWQDPFKNVPRSDKILFICFIFLLSTIVNIDFLILVCMSG